jgi:hypothetical protein
MGLKDWINRLSVAKLPRESKSPMRTLKGPQLRVAGAFGPRTEPCLFATVQACKSLVAEIFKNLAFGPGCGLKNLAVYIFEGIPSSASPSAAGKT